MTKRTAISLPDDLFREIERARRARGRTGAAGSKKRWVFTSRAPMRRPRSKRISKGYTRIPDTDDDFEAIAGYNIKRLRKGR